MSKLTPTQIQSIFDFTTTKYIKYYDVQLELVDHIANRIEELQTEDVQLTFIKPCIRSISPLEFMALLRCRRRKSDKWRNSGIRNFGHTI